MEDQNEFDNNIQDEEEFELDIEEFEDMRTDEEKKTSFKEMYRNPKVLPIVEEPKIYSQDQNDNLKSYLRPKDFVKYTHYKKKQDNNFGKDNKMIVFPSNIDNLQYSFNISQKISELIQKEDNKHGEIIRKVLFFKRQNEAHIACVCLFIDKYANQNTIIIPSYDVQFLKTPLQYNKNTHIAYIPLQADNKSCGVVALKMAKHLNNKWYYQNKDELFELPINNKTILPENMVPKKLLSYKQPDLWKMYEYNNNIFKENFENGYIKNIKFPKKKTEKNQKIVSDAKNVKLQESKSRRLYENYYQKEKDKLDKKDPKYRDQKQKIIKNIEEKYEKNENDISNASISSKEEKDLITYL